MYGAGIKTCMEGYCRCAKRRIEASIIYYLLKKDATDSFRCPTVGNCPLTFWENRVQC